MSPSGLFLDPDVQQALVRKAHAERSEFIASSFRQLVAWMRRAPAPNPRPRASAKLPERVQALLAQHWGAAQPERR